MTLTEFLLARIAEDESATGDDQWHRADCEVNGDSIGARPCDCGVPARVLAECEAKREIVNGYAELNGWAVRDEATRGRMEGLLVAAHLLAMPYADHPDYREEWRL